MSLVKSGTNKTPEQLKQINEALDMLQKFGVPLESLTERRLEKMAIAFIAVVGLSPQRQWNDIPETNDGHRLTSREIINYVNERYNENISSGSYDDIRRKDLKLPTMAGIIIKSLADPDAATNNPTRRYAVNPEYIKIIKQYGQENSANIVIEFMKRRKTLSHALSGIREMRKVPIKINNQNFEFSAGLHNEIQKAVIEEFLPRYGYGAEILYVGDTADKYLFLNREKLEELKFFELGHQELPDVIAYSAEKNWLYLFEAVHSANPIDALRHHELEKLVQNCTAGVIYITAFLDRKSSQKFIGEIAWETEVWIADNPDHLIHFNGDRFLGPH